MLLPLIDYAPSQDTMQETFDKLNDAITTINNVLGGGAAGKSLVKVTGADFDTDFVKASIAQSTSDTSPISGTVYTTGTLTTPSDFSRDSVLTFSCIIAKPEEGFAKLELYRNGTIHRTIKFGIIDLSAGGNDYANHFSWTFLEEGDSVNTEYYIKLTLSSSSTFVQHEFVLQSNL